MVLLEVVEGQLLLKDQMREYMDHGDFLESWLYLDFFLGMYDGKTLKDTTVSCGWPAMSACLIVAIQIIMVVAEFYVH